MHIPRPAPHSAHAAILASSCICPFLTECSAQPSDGLAGSRRLTTVCPPSAKMQALLEAGTNIVCDRYSFSGVAFSSAKPGMDFDWCAYPQRAPQLATDRLD